MDVHVAQQNNGGVQWHFGAMLIGREAYDAGEVRHHLRAWTVKGFFTAFMISILPGTSLALTNPVAMDAAGTYELLVEAELAAVPVGYPTP